MEDVGMGHNGGTQVAFTYACILDNTPLPCNKLHIYKGVCAYTFIKSYT
jgi:hypothetical protein